MFVMQLFGLSKIGPNAPIILVDFVKFFSKLIRQNIEDGLLLNKLTLRHIGFDLRMFVQHWSNTQYLSLERQGFLFRPQSKQEYSHLGKVKWVNEWLKNHVSLVNSQKTNQFHVAGILWKNKNFRRIQKQRNGHTNANKVHWNAVLML